MQDKLKEFKLSLEIKKSLKKENFLREELQANKTLEQILVFKPSTMDKFYAVAEQLYEKKAYQEASEVFFFLATLNPHEQSYWIGLGLANQMNTHYEEAIDAYEMAITCEITQPMPYFYLAKCLFAIHDRESAMQALDLTLDYAANQPEYASLTEQAIEARHLLLKHI